VTSVTHANDELTCFNFGCVCLAISTAREHKASDPGCVLQAAAAALRGSLDALAASTDEQLRAAAATAAANADEAAATVAGSLAALQAQTDAAMAAAAKASRTITGAATRSPSLFPLPSVIC